MVQSLPGQETLGSVLGAGVGRGLAEQLPQEINRYRLKSGLRSLQAKAQEGNLTPLDLQAELFTTPGLTPEMAQTIAPYIQSAIAVAQRKKQREGMGAQGGAETGAAGQAAGGAVSPQAGQPMQEPEAGHEPHRILSSPEAINDLGEKLYLTQPWLYPTLDKGIAEANRRYEKQQVDILKVNEAFDKTLEEFTHKDKKETYGQVLGKLQQRFRQQAENDVLEGRLSPEEAARKYGNQALNFAKTRINLTKKGKRFGWLTEGADRRFKAIDEMRHEYDKYGMGEAFKEDLVGLVGTSVPGANQLAFPVQNHKEIFDDIKAYKPKKESTEDFAKRIKPKLRSNDSIWSIALELEKNGGDAEKFVDEISRLNEMDKTLNPRQENELQERSAKPSLGDIYLSVGSKKQIGGKRTFFQNVAKRHLEQVKKYAY